LKEIELIAAIGRMLMRSKFFFLICALLSTTLLSASNTVEVTCQKSFYNPEVIHAKLNEPLIIVLTATDVTHGFALDEFKIAKEVSPGNPVRIEFTPDKAGKFEYYCVVRCGKKHLTMRGTLIVE
jgi:heme/copper-type cytochrome/quinol oxidase subunit 2